MDLFDPTRLSPSHWFADVTEPIDSPVYVVLAVVLTIGLVGAIYLRLMADGMFDGHRYKQRLARRLSNWAIGLCAAGLTILLFRWQPVPVLSKRLWLYLWWLVIVAGAVYVVYFYRRLYPEHLATFEENERRRRYLPRAGAATPRGRRKVRRRR